MVVPFAGRKVCFKGSVVLEQRGEHLLINTERYFFKKNLGSNVGLKISKGTMFDH